MAENKVLALIAAAGTMAVGVGLYLVTRKKPEERPGDIVLSDLVITPLTVGVGEAVAISVLATNIGAGEATRVVRLEVS